MPKNLEKKFVLALDLGTTGNRAIVFDKQQNIVSNIYEEFPQIYPKPGWVEHDAQKIWEATAEILKKTFRQVNPFDVAAIGITNQRETVLLWDKKTGKPISNAIVWQCRRTTAYCQELKKKGYEKLVKEKTGLVLDPYFSASKIHWLLKNINGAEQRAKKGELLAGTIDTWILWKLTGHKLHATDSSNASRTMLFNIHEKSWDKKLCKIFEVPEIILPTVMASSAIYGVLDEKLFGTQVPIASLIGDQQAASFAQGCFVPGIIKNTYGTGLFLLENTGQKIKNSKNLLSTVAWSLGNLKNTEYAVEGSVFIGGAAIGWLRDGLGIIKKASDVENLAKSVPCSAGVFFVPALAGLGAPYWDPSARGMMIGMTRGTKAGHIARATLEAIAYQTRDILEVIKKDTGQNFKMLRVDGGASANNFLMQFQADILGIPVERPKVLETTALGAAALAGLAVRFWKDKEEFNRLRKIDHVFEPKMSKKDRDALYACWTEAVKRARYWA